MEQKQFVVVKFVVKEGKDEEFKSIMQKLKIETRKEPGSIRYDLISNDSLTNEYHLLEEYVNSAAFESHIETHHFKTFLPQVYEYADVTIKAGRLIL